MALYKLLNANTAVKTDDGTTFTFEPILTAYQEYLAWIAAGNTPDTAPPLTPAQQAATAISQGLTVTSTSTPSLNGTYSVAPSSTASINAIATFVILNNAFPIGTSMPWIDASGNAHVFPSIAVFKDFATKIASYVAQLQIYADSKGTIGSLPTSNAVTII